MSDETRDERGGPDGENEPGVENDEAETAYERYSKVDPEDVAHDAGELFAHDAEEPPSTDIPDEGPPPPNA